jgi:hypothetical protein
MAKEIEKLSALGVRALKAPGRYSDGGGLYAIVSKTGRKSWGFLYRWGGRTREAGLGSVDDVALKEARAKAKEGREMLARRPAVDPLSVWRKPEQSRIPTFEEAARAYVDAAGPGWRNAKHRRQVATMLAEPCKSIARLPVDEIATADVLRVVKPLWGRTPNTAARLRGRIEAVLDAARAHGHVDADRPNPARWKGHLKLFIAEAAGQDAALRSHALCRGSCLRRRASRSSD